MAGLASWPHNSAMAGVARNVCVSCGATAPWLARGFHDLPAWRITTHAVLQHSGWSQVGNVASRELVQYHIGDGYFNKGILEVKDDSGQIAVVQLVGRVVNVDVFLGQPLVEPSATYLSLAFRKTVKICNESEFTLDFSWKSFADTIGEEGERTRLLAELSRMETAEHEQLQLQLQEIEDVNSGLTDSPFDVRKTQDTKYRHLRKATLDDSMQFVDACFSITPLSGRVWAHSEVDVVVCFTPEEAHLYSCRAFLEIAGQAARLPLQLRGQGIGPKAKVVYNEPVDFGDVFINDERTRGFTIQNKGEIPAEFELIPLTTPPGTLLTVHPRYGTLAVNEMLKIEVTFCSQELGEAFYHICFGMQGSDEQLAARFKANVIPPVFHFDVDQVDFGAISYSFPQTRTVKLVNASKIAMKYFLRVPEEANYKQKELELIPSDGKLDPYGEQQISIRFTSHNVKVYQYELVVGVPGVGADLLSIPVRAQCFVPEIAVLKQELDFGRCFLRYPHKQMLVLENKSTHLFGRFEIGEQDDHSRAIATYSTSEFTGSVSPGERVTDLPLSVTLSATGSGPKVELDQPEINWGNCSCLVDHERTLRMTNVSLIAAAYKTFVRGARSKFQIDQKEGVLMAGESLDFVLVANLDDTMVFKDQLHILITEGDNLVVPLWIRGTGTTMWSPSELRVIDFSHQMTSKECEWSCTLENKGKRVQVLTWTNKIVAVANSKLNPTDRGTSKSRAGQDNRSTTKPSNTGNNNRNGMNGAPDGPDEVIPAFSVFPGTIELKPRTACIFVFKGLSSTAGLIQEELVCETRVGKEKVSRVAFVTAIRANFIDPKLTPSSSLLSFEYIHHPGKQIITQSQPLSFTNACELPLSFTLRTQTPFALDCWEAVLQPEDEKEALSSATAKKPYIPINQVFDILPIRGTLKPNESEKIDFVYYGHANRKFKSTVACEVGGGPEYELTLLGEASSLVYKLDKQSLDFGQVLYNKTEDRDFYILNVGKVPFSFNIVVDSVACGRALEISPISGRIAPNEKQKILTRLRPGIPEYFEETMVLEIAHFEPIPFKLFGSGTFAAVSLNLPREPHSSSAVRGEEPKWKELKKRAKQSIELGMQSSAVADPRNSQRLLSSNTAMAVLDSKSTVSTAGREIEKLSSAVLLPASPQAKGASQRIGALGSPGRGVATSAVDELDIEIEACRLFFADYLLVQEAIKAEARALKTIEAHHDHPTEKDPGSTKAATKPFRPPSSTSDAKKRRGTEVFPFVMSQFVLDFGNVVVGTHKIKRFSVTNIGHGPASFQLDKNLASSRGFQIEPERVVRLPEKESVEFSVTFHARKNVGMGLHMTQLPIVIKNRPPCIAMVRALVTVPDISISTESLDFGKIAVSTCHTMFTQLQNISAVPAEWAFKKPMGSTKDVGNFRFSPQSGLLTPGAKANIQIEFIPDSGRQFMLKLPIKISSNPKTRSIACRGEGSELRISFSPPLIELGPVLPCAPPEEQLVEIRNDSDYPIEVFSLDFDSMYQQDEEQFRSLNAFNAEDMLQLSVRVPGQPIDEYLAENGLAPMSSSDVVSTGGTGQPSELHNPTDSSSHLAENEGIGSKEQRDMTLKSIADFNPAPRKGIDYIMVGPPRCGKSTQARLLAEKESLAIWTIDGAINSICAAKGSLATAARKALVNNKGESEILPSEVPESVEDSTREVESIADRLAHLLNQIVLWRLAQPDLKSGSVLDGFENSFLSVEETLKCCSRAFVTARIIVLGFDEDSYESMSTVLESQTSRPGSGGFVSPSPSRDRLNPVGSGNVGNNDTAGVDGEATDRSVEGEEVQQSAPDTNVALEAETKALSASPSRQSINLEANVREDVSAGTDASEENTVSDKANDLTHSLSAQELKPATFVEYSQMLKAMKRQLALIIVREELEMESSTPLSSEACDNDDAIWSQVKDRATPDRFLLDIPIVDAGPPLLIHICGVPTINNDPRNVFMHRVKSRPEGAFVQKKFVISRNQFEFGPLIITNQQAKAPQTEREFIEWQKTSPNNVEVFRMSNSSKFPIQLEYGMEKQGDDTFVVFPAAVEINEGDTREVKVWANPLEVGLHENALICCIGDNPEPVKFQISCYGCKPELKLRGPWEQPAAASTSEREDHRQADDATTSKTPRSSRSDNPGSAPATSRPSASLVEQPSVPSHSHKQPVLDFEQLLLKRQEEKVFYIENVAPVAVLWRLLCDNLPEDFRIFPVEGTVKPLEKIPVVVVFSAMTEAVHELLLRIEFSDAESALQMNDRNRTVELTLRGEAYKIDVSSFDNETREDPGQATSRAAGNTVSGDGILDFGLVRVGEKHFRVFNIRNRGKYSIKYIIGIRNAVTREYFTIEPSEMVLEPGQSSSVNVTFASKSEVTLRDCKDIKCTIIEMLSGEACREFYVHASARSVFSKFRLRPNHGINFGPHKYSEQAQTKRIEIRNDGEFQFKFRVQASRPVTEREETEPLTLDTPLSPATFSIGHFALSPDCGTIDPGATMRLDVAFQPKECAVYSETLQIEISGRNTEDATETDMLLYELIGESCYPGINTTDYESIFEEQTVICSLGVESVTPMSSLRSSSYHGNAQAVTFAEKEKIFSFGPLIAAANWKGTVERFKISNPMKVSSTVQFSITNGSTGSTESENGSPAFIVQPAVWEIPPLEHRFVSQLFVFVGTTTEPRVALDRASVNFNTLMIGTKTSQSISLINQELIPFNFVLDKTSLDFAGELPALIVHPLSGVIPPNSRTSIEVEFMPTEEKSYSFNLNCIIKRKPTRLSLNVKGEGYSIHDALILTSEDQSESRALVSGLGNLLDFGAVRVNEEAQRFIVIHNNGKFNFDFNWTVTKATEAFIIEPMQGTIKKNDKTTCALRFSPTKQTSLDGMQVTCTIAGSQNYVLALHGNAVPPMLHLSFTSHDFGPCFIAENDAVPVAEMITLTVFNMDPESAIDLDCLFEKKPHLRVDCPPTMVGPRETVSIPIMFIARHEVPYLEVIPFTINGSSTVNVSIRGEGVFPKIELVNSSMQMVFLGNLQIGQQMSRTVKVANRSKRKTVIECVDLAQPGVPLLDALGISVFPQQEISLRAKETADIEFLFAPTRRIPSFQKDVFIRMGVSTKKLLTLSGCCQGIDVILETDTLSYGPICLGSQLVRKVRLQNRGDVAAKFQWNVREFAPEFSVSPSQGNVAPNQHKIIEVTFKPAAVDPDIRYERATCMVEGTTPATLTLVGSCVPQATSSIQDVHFSSPVRQESRKS
ncbi:hypothetical protein PInf_013709 [Phytophthora infestans]|nr:hypothetical protein PInf_013709 [Phytophthora infestans]